MIILIFSLLYTVQLIVQSCNGLHLIDLPLTPEAYYRPKNKLDSRARHKYEPYPRIKGKKVHLRRHWQVADRPDYKIKFKAPGRRVYEDEKDATLKQKIAMLVKQTMTEAEEKMKDVIQIKEQFRKEKHYRAGFVISMVKKSREVLNELFNVAVKHRDEWLALEQLKIFELIVHTNIDTTNFLKQLVEIEEGRDTFDIPDSFKIGDKTNLKPPDPKKPQSDPSDPSDPDKTPPDPNIPQSDPSDPHKTPPDPNIPQSDPSDPDKTPPDPNIPQSDPSDPDQKPPDPNNPQSDPSDPDQKHPDPNIPQSDPSDPDKKPPDPNIPQSDPSDPDKKPPDPNIPQSDPSDPDKKPPDPNNPQSDPSDPNKNPPDPNIPQSDPSDPNKKPPDPNNPQSDPSDPDKKPPDPKNPQSDLSESVALEKLRHYRS